VNGGGREARVGGERDRGVIQCERNRRDTTASLGGGGGGDEAAGISMRSFLGPCRARPQYPTKSGQANNSI